MLRYQYSEGNEFGKRLRRLRKMAGMTLQDLSDALNRAYRMQANKGTISKYENGVHEPNAGTIFCIASVLDVDADYLIGKIDCLDPAGEKSRHDNKAGSEYFSFDMPDASMAPHYKSGDVLIVRTGMPIEDGKIYMVREGQNKPVVRRIRRQHTKWIMEAENKAFQSRGIKFNPSDNMDVIGQVIEFRRAEI